LIFHIRIFLKVFLKILFNKKFFVEVAWFDGKLYLSFKSHQYEYKFIVGAMFFVPRISGFDSLFFSSSVELFFV